MFVIRPHLCEEGGLTVTVNGLCYLTMLEIFLITEVKRKCQPMNKMFFLQDRAAAHSVDVGVDYLRMKFGPCHLLQ